MNVENIMEQLTVFVTTYGLKVVGAILILIIGRMVAGIIRNTLRKAMSKGDMDGNLISFFTNIAYTLVMVFVFLAALAKFGIQTASFVAILGAAGFAIGFALQGSLSNFASGVMLLFFRPFKTGQYVEAGGVAGTVQEIQLFNTILNTPDNVLIIVPNSQIYGGTIKNYSANETRRVDITAGIGYGSSIEEAMKVLHGLFAKDERIMKDPAPAVMVGELADSSVNLVVRVWTKGGDYWPVKFDLTHEIKNAFDAAGIEIPFPQQVVYMNEVKAKA